MPIPIVAVAAQVAARVVTSPQVWQIIGGGLLIIIGAPFVLSAFMSEAVKTFTGLWWLVVLVMIFFIAKIAVPIWLQERGKTQRTKITARSDDDQ